MSGLSAEAVTTIISNLVDTKDRPRVLAAAHASAQMLLSGSSIMLSGDDDLYQVFESMAKSLEARMIREATTRLETIDELLRARIDRGSDTRSATDAACDRWTPVVDASYYTGLALGLRLATGGLHSGSGGEASSGRDASLDRDVSTALSTAIASASPKQKLTLLTLLETPGALSATEGLVAAILGGAR